MKYKVDLQDTIQSNTPNRFHIQRWVNEALNGRIDEANLCIRIVGCEEMQHLNSTYRKKNKPTNVLAFPSDVPAGIQAELKLLGDIVICAELITKEAQEQGKPLEAHWAHIVIHGTLHLLGYDHTDDNDAKQMESIEIDILDKLGFDNPYESNHDNR